MTPIKPANEKLIVVTFKLPINIEEDKETGEFVVYNSKSILNHHLHNLQQRQPVMKSIWIGWPGIFVEDEAKQEKIRQKLAEYDCVPVFFSNELVMSFLQYHEYVLRPLFHNFKSLNVHYDQEAECKLWDVYKDFNIRYMTPIKEVYDSEKDMVWIHDTYLLLLPRFVRKSFIHCRIGFSMHSPFPSSDIYKMFENRKMILKSLLCSDLIGFHIFEYARHFYTACNRLLGLNHEFKQGGQLVIDYFGRSVHLRISHIAVDIKFIHQDLQRLEERP